MTDYYNSHDHAITQLHLGRKIGAEQANLAAGKQIDALREEANRRISHQNNLLDNQAITIDAQAATIRELEAKLAQAMVVVSVQRDTIEEIVTRNPGNLAVIAGLFKSFYQKHVATSISARRIKVEPLKDATFKNDAPKTYSLMAKLLG